MRYFLVLDGSTVVSKAVYSGDVSKADEIAARDAFPHTVQEVDEQTFNSTPY